MSKRLPLPKLSGYGRKPHVNPEEYNAQIAAYKDELYNDYVNAGYRPPSDTYLDRVSIAAVNEYHNYNVAPRPRAPSAWNAYVSQWFDVVFYDRNFKQSKFPTATTRRGAVLKYLSKKYHSTNPSNIRYDGVKPIDPSPLFKEPRSKKPTAPKKPRAPSTKPRAPSTKPRAPRAKKSVPDKIPGSTIGARPRVSPRKIPGSTIGSRPRVSPRLPPVDLNVDVDVQGSSLRSRKPKGISGRGVSGGCCTCGRGLSGGCCSTDYLSRYPAPLLY